MRWSSIHMQTNTDRKWLTIIISRDMNISFQHLHRRRARWWGQGIHICSAVRMDEECNDFNNDF